MVLVGVELETLVFEPDADHTTISMCDPLDLISAVKRMWTESRTMNIP